MMATAMTAMARFARGFKSRLLVDPEKPGMIPCVSALGPQRLLLRARRACPRYCSDQPRCRAAYSSTSDASTLEGNASSLNCIHITYADVHNDHHSQQQPPPSSGPHGYLPTFLLIRFFLGQGFVGGSSFQVKSDSLLLQVDAITRSQPPK